MLVIGFYYWSFPLSTGNAENGHFIALLGFVLQACLLVVATFCLGTFFCPRNFKFAMEKRYFYLVWIYILIASEVINDSIAESRMWMTYQVI